MEPALNGSTACAPSSLNTDPARRAHYYRASNLSGLRVLVVEDEYHIAEALSGYLRDAGAIVTGTAATVSEGLRLIESGVVAAATLDIRLRDDVVYRLADRLAAANVPYVFYSADFFTLPSRFATVRQIVKDEGFEEVASGLLLTLARYQSGLHPKEIDTLQNADQTVRALRGMARALVRDPDAADDIVEEALRQGIALAESNIPVSSFPELLADFLEQIWLRQKLSRPA